ncbi:crossover junction endodeoxyribonuclease RuvC [Paenibacillus sp. SC116]|uniref:crossover junction endodeoxyribonuclease RuvC n=1 Tax=Paenibacillus sp. SC116 TaxID=2968986 RepID=UPI00215A12A0|nr:crossover junction endodeoxyribonuclease RuvC [Paenibacillus sp. SC116]MCR8843117.1 crossover junction endodeoxyribonuclease RuvC [Paenibacillus sp. SC116]
MTTYHLGLDTSLTKTGWAVVSVRNEVVTLIDYGLIRSNKDLSDGERLRQIHAGITDVINKFPQIERTIPREEGIVRYNLSTRQIFKAHGVTEFSLSEFNVVDVNIQTVKAWARRVTGSPGSRKDKPMIIEAVRKYFGNPDLRLNREGDEADAIAVTIVHLIREGLIAA